MDKKTKEIVWNQFGAAIEAMKMAVEMCPKEHWGDRSGFYQFWYIVSHTLFWLDYQLSIKDEDFHPPEPFGLEELDPAGVIPERIYTKEELLKYLEYGYEKCRNTISEMTNAGAERIITYGKREMPFAEMLLYSMRHIQHHTAQLNMMLRQKIDKAPGWSFQAKTDLY